MLTEQEKIEVQKEALRPVDMCKKLFNVDVGLNIPAPPCLACVYAFEMSNDTVKIGVTKNADKRKKGVNNFLTVKRIHHTAVAPYPFMREMESICHAAFADRRAHGEYFNITFEEAVAELDRHADEIADALHAADEKYLDKIIYFYEEFLPQYNNAKKVEPSVGNLPQVVEIEGVRGYLDKDGIVLLNAADVARELGFVEERKDRVPTSRSKSNLFDSANYINGNYAVVRWARINGYLREFGYKQEVGKDDFLPENIVYRLAMKANNDTAVEFQMKIANEILPSIRKYGYYSVKGEEPVKKISRRPVPELAVVYAVLLSNMLVKIGYTRDLTARLKDLQKETKADVLAWAA